MITERLKINKDYPEPEIIKSAAQRLNNSEVVAFPTETVYGLGAIALNSPAVERIFAAKDRPPANPLIVHIGNFEQAYALVKAWPERAERLARTFWPGPLTLILPADKSVPAVVRGGGIGVGIRMPAHPVALALINATAPLAAPSANRSGRPSPRTADEVWEDLAGRIPLLLDAGATPGGIESTVLDLTGHVPKIIRPGGISRQQLAQCLGTEVSLAKEPIPAQELPHYQTSAHVVLTTKTELPGLLKHLAGKKVALVANEELRTDEESQLIPLLPLVTAGELFTRLRQAEKEAIEVLVLVKDAGLPWDEALEHRVNAAMQSYK